MVNKDLINYRLAALSKSPFRAKFHLKETERIILEEKGIEIICGHALDLITKRLAPAQLLNDGKQTPFKGHPVFIAQHATATCCRGCLYKWHKIEKDRELTESEKEYVVEVIKSWLIKELDKL